MLTRRVYVVGGSITPFIGKGSSLFIDKKHPDFGKKENPTWKQLLKQAVDDTLSACQISGEKAAVIDKTYLGNFTGECFVNQGHMGPGLIGSLPKELLYKPSMRVEGACASGALAVAAARDSILAGSDVALAAGVEVQTTVSARQGGDFLARAADYDRQRKIDDFTFPALFASRMKRIAGRGHFTMDDTAHVAVKAYQNGNKNPLAHMHKAKLAFEKASTTNEKNPAFLGNEEIKDYLRLTDCSQVSDGAAALVLASEEGLKKMGVDAKDAVEVLSMEVACGNLFVDAADPTIMDTCHTAAKRALAAAKVKPDDLQVAEVHDCFTIAEILMYEALGIAKYGDGGRFAREGVTALDGKIPVNTGGGLLSFGHPVGATGVKQILEIFRQMKGQCGDYQLKNIPTVGAALNMGGDDKTGVCTVLKNGAA